MAAKRVGSVTFGLTLVTFGVMFLLSAFIKSFNEFKQKISDLGGNNNEQKE